MKINYGLIPTPTFGRWRVRREKHSSTVGCCVGCGRDTGGFVLCEQCDTFGSGVGLPEWWQRRVMILTDGAIHEDDYSDESCGPYSNAMRDLYLTGSNAND